MAHLNSLQPVSAPADPEEIWLYIMWGQSLISAPRDPSDVSTYPFYWHQPGAKIPGAKCWDKIGRNSWNGMALVDSTRANEPHAWRDLEPGFEVAGYPWEATPADPHRAWYMMFAHLMRSHKGRKVYIVQYGPGGSTLGDRGGGNPFWSTSQLGQGGQSYLDVLMDAYWAPALTAALAEVGGDRQKLVLGGIVVLQGTSEPAADAAEWKNEFLAIADHQRATINPSNPNAIPYVIIQTPPKPEIVGLSTVIELQEQAATERENMVFVPSNEIKRGSDGTHLGTFGNDQLGAAMFRALVDKEGLRAPQGD